jgi:RNA polymerase sigma-70 factor (family 1)
MPAQEYNERLLLNQVAEGNEYAFRQLFDAYRGRLYAFILKIAESKEAAEDAVHDIFLKLWTNKKKLPEIDNLSAYLHQMAHNHAVNGLRRMAKRTLILAELGREPGSTQQDPGDQLVHKEVQDFIRKAIAKLTPQQRTAYLLSREKGLKYEEIATRMNISMFTVKTHIANALQQLRQEIGKSYGSHAAMLILLYRVL